MPFQNFPYTDFQNLNLDWILQKLLELLNNEHGTGAVESVNGKTGVVVLTASDVGAYVKPAGGIPKSDLTAAVQASLNKADTAYQKPVNGIPISDLSSGITVFFLPQWEQEDIGRFMRISQYGEPEWEDYDTAIKAYINVQIADAISGVDALIGTGVIT